MNPLYRNNSRREGRNDRLYEIIMGDRPKLGQRSLSKKVLKSVGLGYVPELTQDTLGTSTVTLPSRFVLSRGNSMDSRSSGTRTPKSGAVTPELKQLPQLNLDKMTEEIASLQVSERPTLSPMMSEDTLTSALPGDIEVDDLAVLERPEVLSPSSDTTLTHSPRSSSPRSHSSDSGSTVTETTIISYIEYINSTCPHIARPFYTPSLILPSWATQELAGYSGWFTKKTKTDFEWERIYFRVPERHVPGANPGYGTISIDITPPLSVELPPEKATLIYVGGILTPKDHNITKWQIDELIDPAGQHKFRLAFVNLRGQHGNPMTSARLFDPHYDNEDFAVAVSYLHNKLPESPLIAHSFSFGGPVVARYISQLGAACPLHAAVLFAPCLNIARGLERFHQNKITRPGSIYSAKAIQKMYTSVADKFAAAGFPIDKIPEPKGPWVADLYEVLMPYLTGRTYEDFTESLLRDLEIGIPNITVPTFYIGSYRDDSTGSEIRMHKAIEKNKNIIRLMAQSKSHLGYYSGLIKPKRWAQKPMFEFIQAMADVPMRKDDGRLAWDRYPDGIKIEYIALAEKDNPDAKPRRGKTDIRNAS